jgi:hypothetical protein
MMGFAQQLKLWIGWACLTTTLAGAQGSSVPGKGSVPLALVGGTVIDLSEWGHSAKDLQDAVVIVRDGRIAEVGPRSLVQIPKGARILDCTGKYVIPGLVDGYAGLNSQGQASAYLYMGVTTVVAFSDSRRGFVDLSANPSPHLYLADTVGTTDDFSLLAHRGHGNGHGRDWPAKLAVSTRPAELSPDDTAHQLVDQSHLGVRVLLLGHNLTAANTQWIIAHAHQIGLVTYGEFVSTPYKVGIEAGVDALPHMGRYELGAIPDELQKPLVDDPEGTAAQTAFDYSEKIPPVDLRLRNYARLLASHHAALMPTLSIYFLQLPGHRNLWREPAAALLDPARMSNPSDRTSGELSYPVSPWVRHLPNSTQHWMEDGQRRKADQSALRFWHINEAIFAANPHYLAASGAAVQGTMPGISLHTELEMLVRLGLSPREALAAATNNYALQFGWNELGLVAPGRRADLLVVDGDPTASVWNARRISTILLEGNPVDREALLSGKR